MKSRQWLLASRPTAEITRNNFTLVERDIGEPDLDKGQILVKHQILVCAPAMRGWMQADRPSFVPGIDPGDPIISIAGSKVVKSANAAFPEGARIFCFGAWQDYQVIDPAAAQSRVIEDDLSLADAIGIYNMNAMTAYFGLIKVGEPKAGETLVVSGAAGSTGSVVVQIGKILGLRVIGIAGGAEKCGWVVNDYGADAVIDYKSENVAERLAELCPDRIDIFYDNVGGDILQAAVDNIAQYGRIVLCGQISGYDADRPAPGPRDMMQLVYGSVRMQGFLTYDYASEFDKGRADLRNWIDSGRIKHREDIRPGFENLPETYAALFHGENRGSLLALLDAEALRIPA
ncbi:MAG: NADP-dependent oxidoreductase [Sphingomonadales bacterium]